MYMDIAEYAYLEKCRREAFFQCPVRGKSVGACRGGRRLGQGCVYRGVYEGKITECGGR